MKNLVFFLVSLLAPVVWSSTIQDTMGRIDPIVRTSQGLVRGIRSRDGDYSSFLGIPFAEVNASNPFGAALPAPVFEETFQAFEEQIACPQTDHYFIGMNWRTTLDCLRLNIYVPDEADAHNQLPVMVWVHGGAFAHGKAGQHYPWHLVKRGIILVTINYRLGPYGFLCLNTPEVPGNQGLKDQRAAFRWVKQNIAAFGGNPDRITIAGQSAGGSSVNLHLYYAKEDLFNQAIVQSGITTLTLSPNDELAAVKLAQVIGYNAPNPESALQFLINSPTELVTRATEILDIYYGPCVERADAPDSFMTTNPIIDTFPRTNLPVFIGVTSMELIGTGQFSIFSTSFRNGIDNFFNLDDEEAQQVADIAQHFYAGNEVDSFTIRSTLAQFDSELYQNYPMAREITKLVAQGVGPVYNYVFEYVSERDNGDRQNMKAAHSAELKYLFSYTFTDGQYILDYNEEEQEVSDRICTLWVNFVKNGNPTPPFSGVILPTVSGEERPYLAIGLQNRLEHGFEHENIAFWDLLYGTYRDQEVLLSV